MLDGIRRVALAKAHAQLASELIRKEQGWTYASEKLGDDCWTSVQPTGAISGKDTGSYCREYKVLGRG